LSLPCGEQKRQTRADETKQGTTGLLAAVGDRDNPSGSLAGVAYQQSGERFL